MDVETDEKRLFRHNEGIDIEFSDVSYSVAVWTPGRILWPGIETKQILKNINGRFYKRQTCAIIGGSGSGKSSLLHFLSGYKTTGYSGAININGQPRNRKHFIKKSSYIMQDDHLQSYLTVSESMEIATKLSNGINKLDIKHRNLIKKILDSLKLAGKQNTLAVKLSGGERRRLTIAIELIRNPKVMFFDEPTTGLDVVSVNSVVSMLKDLANCGKTIICTVHQASASQLEMFDMLYVLSPSGQCIYRGNSSNLVKYLSSVGFQCPLHHNPGDYVIEVSSGEYGDHNVTLVKYIDNGKSDDWIQDKYTEDIQMQNDNADNCSDHKQSSKFYNELRVLIFRRIISTSRDSTFIIIRLFVPIILSIMFGVTYYNIGKNGSLTQDNVILLFFTVMTAINFSGYSMTIFFPMELNLTQLEFFNQWYSFNSYYTCVTLVDLPIQIFSVASFMSVIYVMSGQPFELFRFFMMLLILTLTGLMVQAVGMFIAVLFKRFLVNITVMTLAIIIPMLLFAGIMVHIDDTPKMYRWIYDISVLKYSMQGILHAIYGYNRPALQCPEIYCHNSAPELILRNYGMEKNLFWTSVTYITALYIFLKICIYVILKRKLS